MNLKFFALSFILLSVLFTFPFPSVTEASSSQGLGPGPSTYVIATIAGNPQTVDPALAHDTASSELIANIYDTLIAFKGSKTSEFVPWLAESYSVSGDGLTYQFKIRPNVPWQNATYGFVTPADAEYSLERVMVRDYQDFYYFGDSLSWMFWYPIFGVFKANDFGALSDSAVATMVGNKIDSAITSNATHLTIQFQTGKAYLPFLGILAQTWGSILSRQWCIDLGDWNPDVDKLDDGTWVRAHNPAASPLDGPPAVMMGSGPFKLDYLDEGVSWSIVRNAAFWGGWGTTRGSLLGITTPSLGYLDRITEYFIYDSATRLAGFLGTNPIYDSIYVPRSQISTVWQQLGVKCSYPLPTAAVDGLFFSYNVSMRSPYIGSPTNSTYFGPDGIRPDFFSDVHARRAVAYSLNWSQFILSAYLGEAEQPVLPLPVWDAFYNSSLTGYGINIAKAIEEWKLAWNGQVWANGFRFGIVHNDWYGQPRYTVANMLKTALEAENPKFHLDVYETWSVAYGRVWHGGLGGRALGPIFQVGWLMDYPDADSWVTPFIESSGTFSYPQHIDMDPYSPLMDQLIEWARHNTTVEGRNYNYQKLWQLYIQQAPSIPLENAIGRRFERDWIQGWYFNPAYPGIYGYTMWKQELPWEDTNSDGKVDIKDLAVAAKSFGAYYIQPLLPPNPSGPPGYYTPNWNSKADVNIANTVTSGRGDMKIDIRDLAAIARLFGYVAPEWQPPP